MSNNPYDHPYLNPVDADNADQATCQMCDPHPRPAVALVSSPADTGPFTDVEESTDLRPDARWDVPLCLDHARAMLTVVICNSCHVALFAVDAMTNGSTINLCRPCNHRENANLMPGAGTTPDTL